MKLFTPSFVEIYDHALTDEQCDGLIDAFESPRTNKAEGVSINEGKTYVNPTVKKDMEMCLTQFSVPTYVTNTITPVLVEHISQYVDKYPSIGSIGDMGLSDTYSFQKYTDETDGYKSWHTEAGNCIEAAIRVLVWMFYLNDAKSGTDFYHQGRVKAKKGRLVIWPAGFTHMHRSQLPNKGLKYIITGWTSFSNFDVEFREQ